MSAERHSGYDGNHPVRQSLVQVESFGNIVPTNEEMEAEYAPEIDAIKRLYIPLDAATSKRIWNKIAEKINLQE